MKKIVEVNSCAECPHSCDNGKIFYCAHADKLIPYINEIPDFCLLEDAVDL